MTLLVTAILLGLLVALLAALILPHSFAALVGVIVGFLYYVTHGGGNA